MSDKNLNNSLNFHNKFLDKGSQRMVLRDDSEDINELHKNISSFIYLVFSNSILCREHNLFKIVCVCLLPEPL